ncbi:hypothetical protein ACOME3_002206 [Neoechinorhynchus agilis]
MNLICTILKNENEIWSINWEILDKLLYPHSTAESSKFEFNETNYTDAIVVPNYRQTEFSEYYRVVSIDRSSSPVSTFPITKQKRQNMNFDMTFEQYFLSKYKVNLTNPSQPLLVVERCSSRMSLLTPRYMCAIPFEGIRGLKKYASGTRRIFLIPELVNVHPLPATIYCQLRALPSCLYQLDNLAKSEELRRLISAETGIGQIEPDKDTFYEPLSFAWDASKELSMSIIETEDRSGLDSSAFPCDFEIDDFKLGEYIDSRWMQKRELEDEEDQLFVFDARNVPLLEGDEYSLVSYDEHDETFSVSSKTQKFDLDVSALSSEFKSTDKATRVKFRLKMLNQLAKSSSTLSEATTTFELDECLVIDTLIQNAKEDVFSVVIDCLAIVELIFDVISEIDELDAMKLVEQYKSPDYFLICGYLYERAFPSLAVGILVALLLSCDDLYDQLF